MESDVECPYCGTGQEINDDYDHQQVCFLCGKIFIFKDGEAAAADCLNDGDHDWERILGAPPEYRANHYRCIQCGYEAVLPNGEEVEDGVC
jgi:DNA-directed RNA polymerase subunit RPC12/RpoP